MASRWGNNGNSERLYFEGFQNHCRWWLQPWNFKRHLLLGRKVMTNSILKSGDITLPTKAHLVKAMVFPAVMYGCESWTVKKAESGRVYAFELWCWRILFRVPWTARRPNQSISKLVNPEYSLAGLMLKLKLQYFGHLMKSQLIGKDPDAGEDWGQEKQGATEDETVGWHHRLNGREFEQAPGDSEGQGSLACCSPWDCKELTQPSGWQQQRTHRGLSPSLIRSTHFPLSHSVSLCPIDPS